MIWFLSFADGNRPKGTQFLGGCVVQAYDFMEAIQVAHVKECNPGGEVQGRELGNLPECVEETKSFHDRLLTHDECDAFFDAFFAACEAHAGKKAALTAINADRCRCGEPGAQDCPLHAGWGA